jgi:hypothetical protein
VATALTAADVPPEPTIAASAARCLEHPDANSLPGFGYRGGGFGPYRSCDACGGVFAKTTVKDGNG